MKHISKKISLIMTLIKMMKLMLNKFVRGFGTRDWHASTQGPLLMCISKGDKYAQ